jgi:hypothetical protein
MNYKNDASNTIIKIDALMKEIWTEYCRKEDVSKLAYKLQHLTNELINKVTK